MKKLYPVKIYESDNVLYLSERHAFEIMRTRLQINIGYILLGMSYTFKFYNYHPTQNAIKAYAYIDASAEGYSQ
ncbi:MULTISPECIES: hypothetical protein [unclassified Enterococcus]|uniref:hypothetical protein n=1 Tax=unclassified Enterococcus TaxID=2608891 RepID=UPI001552B75F|nr:MULTISPECIES: hypothetical protein [unclassified Enterococcus]MBS7578316.1 hypothetical protein [Enterococcus sp. MMGLQ5-2]MBS7585473.1 hypothetical protein [Enterococcus sp. MMGLQ5-1]NPD13330.1 hypothetical protein [Enterococcus sp. MMGLQ5-1]NPD38147.1 hypothetical protein [Enterococcus sp. MMGLQ5-2]